METKDKEEFAMLSCVLRKMEVTIFMIDPDVRPNVNPEGLIQNLLLYATEMWEPIVRISVNRCFDDLEGTVEQFYCGDTIPMLLLDLIVCIHKENLLNCPTYNPNNLTVCEPTYSFVKECI
jgi:hypothetical protein